MKKVLISFLWILGLVVANPISAQEDDCVISTFPWTEGFEDDGANLEACWTQEQINGTLTWTVGSGGASSTVHKVSITMGNGPITRLITPPINLSGLAEPILNFWHTQQAWGNDQDILRIYYKTAANGTWKLLEEYTSNVPSWTERILPLPEPSADYYIAFEAVLKFGFGIELDEISIRQISTTPIIAGDSGLAFGNIYNNLPWSFTREYTIQNQGAEPLIISSAVSEDPNMTITGLPLTINKLEKSTISVTLNAPQLLDGAYNGSFKLLSNDLNTPEFVVDVTATAEPAIISNYIRENFNGKDPAGWGTQAFSKLTDGGIDNSGCIRGLLNANQSQGGVQTCYIEMGSAPKVSFHYKALNYSDWAPAAADALEYAVFVSNDNGSTWNPILSVDAGGHVPSDNFARIDVDASDYADKLCLVQFVFEPVSPAEIWVYLDDVYVGTEPINELEVVGIKGNLVPLPGFADNYTVSVTNLGSASSTNYTVKLKKDDDTELASLPGVAIAQYETHDFVFEWTPDVPGIVYLYGEVVFAEDEFMENNTTDKLKVFVQLETIELITIGDGTELYRAPYNLYYNASLSQTLYLSNELGINGGEIHSLIYKANVVYEGSNLEDVGIQIWIGETDRDNLRDGWVTPSTLTEVFNGTISFPAGQYDLVVPLDIPYQYNGGNLVVYSQRKDQRGGDWNDYFYGTAYPNSYRTMLYSIFSGSIDPQNPPAMFYESIHGIPNTTFLIDMDGMGSLSGVVSDGTNPMEGVDVRIAGTQLFCITNAAGEYHFPNLANGPCAVEASIYGYITQTIDVAILPNDAVTQNITMSLIPTFTVSGKVVGPNPEVGLEEVQISLSGYKDYVAITDVQGNYSIPDVYGGFTYEVLAKTRGYVPHRSNLEVANGNLVFNIELEEKSYPVANLFATEEDNDAVVTWDAPPGYEGKSYILDDGVFENGWRYDNAELTAWYGTRFDAGEDGELTSIDLYGLEPQFGEASDRKLTIDVFDEDRQLVGSSEPFFLPGYDWVNVPLDNIPYSTVFYVMVKWSPSDEGATNYLGYDQDGPYASEGTDWYYDDSTGWQTMFTQTWGMSQGVFMIRANADAEIGSASTTYANFDFARMRPDDATPSDVTPKARVENDGLDFIKLASPIDANAQYNYEALSGKSIPVPVEYTIYRLEEDDPEESWTLLSTLAETTYTDTGWSALGEGAYQYAVTARFTSSKVSVPRLSNLMLRGLEVGVTINVTTNSGDPTSGAVVTLTNQNGNPEMVHSATVEGDAPVQFPIVRKGTYDLEVLLEGYEPYNVQGIVIDTNLTHDAELIEIIVPLFGLRIVETENPTDRLFLWNVIDPEETKISYYIEPDNYNWINSLYQSLGVGYGVVFDLTNYTDAVLLSMDFHHAPWGFGGIWDYKVHVFDVDASQMVYSSETIQTTDDFIWEENISLNDMADLGGKRIGVFVEPLSMVEDAAFPTVSADRDSSNAHSYRLDLSTLDLSLIVGQNNFGEYLMNLWIMAAQSGKQKISGDGKSLANYTVYLDGEQKATTNDTQYLFSGLAYGDHTAGVKAVYTSGETAIQTIDFAVGMPDNIEYAALSDIRVYSHLNNIYIVNEHNVRLELIQVINMLGSLVYETRNDASTMFSVDIASGHYVVRLISEEGKVYTTKLYLTNGSKSPFHNK